MKGMKGLELPLNMIVLIIIAVLVLLVVAAVFTGQFSLNVGIISDSTALERGCQLWRAQSCQTSLFSSIIIPGYKPGGQDADAPLSVACQRNGFVDVTACRSRCACPA
jgi:hypothetical protein